MYTIAVNLSGPPRFLGRTKSLFNRWNTLYPDVKFTFIYATWVPMKVPCGPDKPLEEYFFDHIRYIHTTDVLLDVVKKYWGRLEPIWAYCFQQSHQLRIDTQMEFDAVIHTYTDSIIFKEHLDSIVEILKNGIKQYTVYSIGGVKEKTLGSKVVSYISNPKFKFGTTATFDKYYMIFDEVFINNSLPDELKEFHIVNYYHMINNNIQSEEILTKDEKSFLDYQKVLPLRFKKPNTVPKKYRTVEGLSNASSQFFSRTMEENIEIINNPIYFK